LGVIRPAQDTVSVDNPIAVGIFNGFSWIRVEGKGSFVNSPAVKAFGDGRIAAGEGVLVVDLAACTGMDSTFMGTLAGLAARLSAVEGGRLHIAEPGERNRRSLEDLGLDFLMDIDPPSAVWRGRVDEVRGQLHAPAAIGEIGRTQRSRHVLEAHQTLSTINDKNARSFAGVVGMLASEIAEKERLAKEGGNV
jgi:anti-anti-sigma regulatory factor